MWNASIFNLLTSQTFMFLDSSHTFMFWSSLMAQLVKNLPAMWETRVWSLGWEDPLQKGTPTHSGFLAWRIPRTVESMGWQRFRHTWATFTLLSDTYVCAGKKASCQGFFFFFFFFFYGIIFCCRDIAQFIYSSVIRSLICFTSFLFCISNNLAMNVLTYYLMYTEACIQTTKQSCCYSFPKWRNC